MRFYGHRSTPRLLSLFTALGGFGRMLEPRRVIRHVSDRFFILSRPVGIRRLSVSFAAFRRLLRVAQPLFVPRASLWVTRVKGLLPSEVPFQRTLLVVCEKHVSRLCRV
jgi:hypothetical protein